MLKHVSYRSSSNFSKSADLDSFRRSRILTEFNENCTHNPERDYNSQYKLSNGYVISPDNKCAVDTISLKNFNDDSISINSSFSYGSFAQGNFASRCSSTLSLNDPSAIPLKVYLRKLRPDMEYKTLPMSTATTCRELILSLLAKFRLRHRDPNLFFVTMEVSVKSADSVVKRVLVLDDNSRPAELQQCRPKGEARFSIGLRRGGLIRVHDSILMTGSQYKSLLIAHHTTAKEVVQLLLSCYNKTDSPNLYSLHEVCQNPFKDRALLDNECPLDVQAKWPKYSRSNRCFIIRRNSVYNLHLKSKLTWRRSLDQGSTDTESEPDEHNTTRASIISSGSTSSGISSISLDSSSSGVSSGDDSCISNSSPIKFSQRVLNTLSSTSLHLFKASEKQIYTPMHSTPKLSSRLPSNFSISKLSIILDNGPVEDKIQRSYDKQIFNKELLVEDKIKLSNDKQLFNKEPLVEDNKEPSLGKQVFNKELPVEDKIEQSYEKQIFSKELSTDEKIKQISIKECIPREEKIKRISNKECIPTEEKTEQSNFTQTVNKELSIITSPPIPYIPKLPELKINYSPTIENDATIDKSKVKESNISSSIFSDLHPKISPRRFSIVPVFSTDVRYSWLNTQESRKLPQIPSVPPEKKPPKPVPRTLFPPIRSRSLGRTTCLIEKKVDDSGFECSDHSSKCTTHTNNSVSNISFGVLSHSSPKKAKIRSLSKSFVNLSVTSLKDGTKSVCSASCKKKLVEKDEKMSNPKDNESGDLKINRPLTISLHNLAENSQCKRNCQSCFYI